MDMVKVRAHFLAIVLGVAVVFGVYPVAGTMAENSTPYPGTKMVETGKSFDVYVDALRAAVTANGLGIVSEACATCGAKKIGVTIPGNRVIMVYHPRFAVRMLEASVPAGIEAPLRLYVTEQSDGMAKLTYREPSAIFGVYKNDILDEMAAELDGVIDKIVADSVS
jgi:uncharacterized protein (DUF302 family)